MPASAATQRASFAQCMPLTVSRLPADGSGGTASVSPSSSVGCPPGRFVQGAAVTLTATQAAGWGFAGWTGTLTSSAATWSYTMGSASAVQTAHFGQCFPLTLSSAGSPVGTVSANPSKSLSCSEGWFVAGEALTLTAQRDINIASTFLGWSGDVSGTATPLAFTMPASASSTTATFVACVQLSIWLLMAGGAGGGVHSATTWTHSCSLSYFPVGAPVTITATPVTGSTFDSWTGGLTGTDNPLLLTMPASTPPTSYANFQRCLVLTVQASTGGTVSALLPASFGSCAPGSYPPYTEVTVNATANTNYLFEKWSGAASSTSFSLVFITDSVDSTLTANFRQRDFVYGQLEYSTITLSNPSAPAGGFNYPYDLKVSATDELYLADFGDNRVLVYPYNSLTPTRVIGQPDFVSTGINRGLGAASPTAKSFNGPMGLAFDPSTGNLLVADWSNNRVLVFPPGANATTDAIQVYGQNGAFTTKGVPSPCNANSLNSPAGVAVDAGGVFIVDGNNYRVLFYPGTSTTATRVYGQGSFTTRSVGSGAAGFGTPRFVALDATGGIFVSEQTNNRILYFPAGGPTTGQSASRVIGQADLVSYAANRGASNPSANSLKNTQGIALQADGLYVADYSNRRVLRFPVVSGEVADTADRVWGQASFATSTQQTINNGTFVNPYGVAFDSKGNMYVADAYAFRVLRIAV